MTRRDYVKLAEALRRAHLRLNAESFGDARINRRRGLFLATEEIVSTLAADNPRFDGQRFYAAIEHGIG